MVVNNAGVIDLKNWKKTVNVNLVSDLIFFCFHRVLVYLILAIYGHLVNILPMSISSR